ncbi:MAG: tetratricopeptide repeat protein, partial [Anaerolineae bacterium]
RQVYGRGKEKLPADVQLAQAYALVSYRCLPPGEALPLLQDAVDKGSKDPYVFAFLGDCYAALGMKQQAAETYLDGIRRLGTVSPLLERMAKVFGPDHYSP